MKLSPHGTGPEAAKLAARSGKAKGIVNATGIIAAPLTVGRIFEDRFNVELLRSSDPRQLARWYVDTIQGPIIRANPAVTYFEGPNEQAMGSEQDMTLYAAFEAERALILHAEYDVAAAVGGFATGNPLNELIPYFRPALDAAKRYGGILHFHEYGNTLPAATQVAGGFLLGKYRHWLEQDAAIKIAITECGTDNVPPDGHPWRDLGWTDEQYALWLWGYELELRKEPRILAAFIFCFGGGARWAAFELENSRVADLLIALDKADPEREPTMTQWLALEGGTAQEDADAIKALEALGYVAQPTDGLTRMVKARTFKVKMLQAFTLFSGVGYDKPRLTGVKVSTDRVLDVAEVVPQSMYPYTDWFRIVSPAGWLPYDPSWVVKL